MRASGRAHRGRALGLDRTVALVAMICGPRLCACALLAAPISGTLAKRIPHPFPSAPRPDSPLGLVFSTVPAVSSGRPGVETNGFLKDLGVFHTW